MKKKKTPPITSQSVIFSLLQDEQALPQILPSGADRVSVAIVPENASQKLNRFAAIIFSGVSVIAVLPVPYLTLRSISLIVTKKFDLTFSQIMHSDNVCFWIFGPLTSILATLAIAPFNMYNTYKIVRAIDCSKLKKACTVTNGLKTALRLGLMVSGSVNGYNMSVGFHDIFTQESIGAVIAHHSVVTIGVLVAGASEARVVTSFFFKEIPRDLRYMRRGLRKAGKAITVEPSALPLLQSSRSKRKMILRKLQESSDDLGFICQLGLTAEQVKSFGKIFEQGLEVSERAKVLKYFELLKNDFPVGRFIGSEVVGSILSGVWAYFGNLNVLELAYNGLEGFLEYCGLSAGLLMRLICKTGSYVAYGSSALLSFFLIRDLFFRELFKRESISGVSAFIKRILLPSIPALSYGLLNVILTFLNKSLGPAEIVMVASAAVVGATVVSRYGIDNGVREMTGITDLRRTLANLAPLSMEQFREMDNEQLFAIYDGIKGMLNEIHVMAREHIAQEPEDEAIGLTML
jgi:hypothetical protein